MVRSHLLLVAAALVGTAERLVAQRPDTVSVAAHGDSVSARLVDVDLRAAVQALARYLDRPVVFGTVSPGHVTLETPHPVPRAEVVTLLRGVLESQGLELVPDSGLYRVRQRAQPPASAQAQAARPAAADGSVQLFVIRLRHARAADVAATVNALYGRSSALGEPGAPPPSTLDQQLRQQQIAPAGAPVPQGPSPVIARPAELSGDVTIVPDPRSNSLLVRANRGDFELIQAAVEQLDIRPLQVLIEVIIVEARRDRSFAFGLGATLSATRVPGSRRTTVGATQAGPGLQDFVLQVMHLAGADLDATLSAAADRGDVRIVSRPVLIAANNQEASILVGSQRPFVQLARTLATDNTARDEVVQYKDVGTRLVVRPTISADGYVVLQVTQEVNNATSETAFDAPVISTRTVQTELLIKDGQTAVLGGLTDREHDSNQGGVPGLSSIPLVGGLFGHASRQSTEDELFLFITPRVIKSDQDADSLTQPLLQKARSREP